MKKPLLFLLPTLMWAQTLTLSVSPTSTKPGGAVTVSQTFTPSVTAPVSGVQSNVAGVPGSAFSTWTAGGATTAASKTTSGNQSAQLTAGSAVSAGANTVLGAGVVATSTLTIPANTPPGPLTLSMTGLTATNSTGQPVISIGSGPPVVLTVGCGTCDVNGDGVVNATDLNIVITQVLGAYFGGPCTTGDVNGDGKCDVKDVQLVANAIP